MILGHRQAFHFAYFMALLCGCDYLNRFLF